MENKNLKFYKLGDESNFEVINYDNKKIESNNIAEQKKVNEEYTMELNFGMKSLIARDMKSLSSKIESRNKDIIKKLAVGGIVLEQKLDSDVKNIDLIINNLEEIISSVIIKKGSIKIGLFSSNKQEKKNEISRLQELINYLSKCQNDFIVIKDEYSKLKERGNKVIDTNIIDKKEEIDPLERTINFYMKKQQKDN